MRRLASIAAMMGALTMIEVRDPLGDSRPSKTEADLKREKEAAKAQREAWPADPETRQQRRARERRERKGKA